MFIVRMRQHLHVLSSYIDGVARWCVTVNFAVSLGNTIFWVTLSTPVETQICVAVSASHVIFTHFMGSFHVLKQKTVGFSDELPISKLNRFRYTWFDMCNIWKPWSCEWNCIMHYVLSTGLELIEVKGLLACFAIDWMLSVSNGQLWWIQ